MAAAPVAVKHRITGLRDLWTPRPQDYGQPFAPCQFIEAARLNQVDKPAARVGESHYGTNGYYRET